MSAKNRRLVAVFLLISISFMSAIYAAQGTLLSSMIDAFSLTGTSQGTAGSISFAGGIVSLVVAFFLQGRIRKRKLLVISILLCVIGLLLLWISPTYGVYVCIWGMIGFGVGLMDTVLSACMADLYTGEMGTRMMCILHMCFGLFSVVMPMVYTGMLSGGITWKQVYLIVAIAGAVYLFVSQVIKVRRQIRDTEVLTPGSSSIGSVLQSISENHLIGLVAAMFFQGIYLSGLNTWINRYADSISAFSIPAQSCLFMGVMLSRLLMPFLPVRTDHYVKWAGFAGTIALAAGMLMHNGILLRIFLAITGFMVGAMIPCILSLGCERSRENTLLATTAMMFTLYLGQCVSSPTIALLYNRIGADAGIGLCVVCMSLCSLCCMFERQKMSE